MYVIKTPEINDPAINLAIEEFATRNLDISQEYLFLYTNASSVIIGKNQNPFEEIDLSFLKGKNLKHYRRISGGGAVYHGPGNINFSYITQNNKRFFNTYTQFLKPVKEALENLGAAAQINSRNDLVIGDKKISGNAQFTSRNRLLSHGTLLYNANLQNLRGALNNETREIISKSTKSVRSSVANVSDFLENPVTPEELILHLQKYITGEFGLQGFVEFNSGQWAEIEKLAQEKYNKWEWNWGRTPKFRFSVKDINLKFKAVLEIKNCLIVDVEIVGAPPATLRAVKALNGIKYTLESIHNKLKETGLPDEAKQSLTRLIYPF